MVTLTHATQGMIASIIECYSLHTRNAGYKSVMPRLSVFVFLNLVELVAKRCKNHLHVVEYIESGKVLHAGGSFGSLVHAGWVRANKLQHPFSLELAHSHLILT